MAMRRALQQCRATPQLGRWLETALPIARAASNAAAHSGHVGAPGSGLGDGREETSKPKRDNRPRYLVADRQAGGALELLEKSFHRTPVIYPSAEGGKTRYLQLPPPQVCSKVLQSAAHDPKLVMRAAELADALMLQGVQLEPHALKQLVEGLARRGKVALALSPLDRWLAQHAEQLEAEEEDRGLRAEALHMLTALVDAAARGEDTRLLQQVLARMAKIGLMPTMGSITSLLQCFMRLGQPQVAHSILEWMRRGGLQPNIFHYTTLMAMPRDLDATGAARLLRQAQETYERMQEDGVQPNTHFFTALIRLCGRARDMDVAMQVWQDVAALGLKPDLILYSALIDTCAKCHSPGKALELFETMKAGGVQPDVVTFASLLTALQGPPAQPAAARQVWAEMKAAGVEPNSFAVAAFLDILLTEGEIDQALQLLTEASQQLTAPQGGRAAKAGRGRGASQAAELVRLYEHFMVAMAHKGEYDVVEHLSRHLRSRGLRQTLGTASALLFSQALQRNVSNGRWLLYPDDSAVAHLEPGSSHTASHGHHNHGHQPQRPTIAARQLPLNLSEQLVDVCLLGKGSTADYAQQLMAGGKGVELTPVALNLLLGGLAVQGEAARAFEVYDWAQLEGVRVDRWTFRLLMFAALNARPGLQFDLLMRVLGEARQHFPSSRPRGRQQQQEQQRRRQQRGQQQPHAGVWDQRTRSAIQAAMRTSNKARELLGDSSGELQTAEQSEANLRRVLGMLGRH